VGADCVSLVEEPEGLAPELWLIRPVRSLVLSRTEGESFGEDWDGLEVDGLGILKLVGRSFRLEGQLGVPSRAKKRFVQIYTCRRLPCLEGPK
jgi:hypothetical protein